MHISAKYTIMLSCTRLHVYIRASLVMYVCSRRLPTIMTSSLHARRAVACAENPSETVLTFMYISPQPHFDLEPDYIFKKPIKRRFKRYIVRTEIFSTFHARVEYVIPPIQINGTECAQTHTQTHIHTHTHKSENIISAILLRSLGGYNE